MYLCASLSSATLQELRDDYERAMASGADLVEIRLDCLGRSELDFIGDLDPWMKEHADKLIVTFRALSQGGHHEGETSERINTLLWAAGFKPRFIDFEQEYYERSPDIGDKVEQMASATEGGRLEGIILSEHHTQDRPARLTSKFLAMSETPAEAIKLVWVARDARDNFEAFDLLESAKRPAIAFCTHADGLPSRVLGRKFGQPITYCALEKGAETAPGQPTLDDMINVFHWRSITEDTEVLGLIGDPVEQSLSAHVLNAAFAQEGVDAVYLPFRVPGDGHAFADFIQGVADRPWLNLRGFSVTSPHKRHAWLLTQEDLDPVTRRTESVNTLHFTDNTVRGANTDYQAATDWLTSGLNCNLPDLADMEVDVIGAGGMARTMTAALRLIRARVKIYNRTAARAQEMADAFDCQAAVLDDNAQFSGDVLINCTTVGMWPDIYRSPLKADQIKPGSTVFDAVYNPKKTQLLQDAGGRDCRIVSGLGLFIKQAALQYTIWTGRLAPIDIMREVALAKLSADA